MENSLKAGFGWYELVISRFIDPSTPPGVMLDIGVGPKSEYLKLKQLYPDMDLVGLEPNPDTYERVLPKFPGVLKRLAITEDGQPAEFTVHEENVMASGLIPYETTPVTARSFVVEGTTLDALDASLGHPDRILVWMDIEGYELRALRSGPELFASGRVKWLNLEVRNRWNAKRLGCTEDQVDEFLGKYGYEKLFAYNHYPSSHQHDAIYVLKGMNIPNSGRHYSAFFRDQLSRDFARADATDLALGTVDLYMALEEARDKISYLRNEMQKIKT